VNYISLYSYLSPTKQWQLHDFFRLSEALTKEELLAHRQAITANRPSLPHQAGHALSALDELLLVKAKTTAPSTAKVSATGKSATRAIRVRSIVQSKVDLMQLAKALIDTEQERDKHKQ
jgi:hypothetical protein